MLHYDYFLFESLIFPLVAVKLNFKRNCSLTFLILYLINCRDSRHVWKGDERQGKG